MDTFLEIQINSEGTFGNLRSAIKYEKDSSSLENKLIQLMNRTNKVIKTYNSAADSFEMKPLGFWSFFGRQTVEHAGLKKGDKVLDVCCGSGASALPASKEVGREGLVFGVDIAHNLLKIAHDKTVVEGLDQVYFMKADMEQIHFVGHRFDAVICVFGIFFFEDMAGQLAKLWNLLRPTGKIAITTWSHDIFSAASEIWKAELSQIRPDLVSDFNPWDEITSKQGLTHLFSQAGIQNVQIDLVERDQNLQTPGDFWTIAMGSGFRWAIEQLNTEERSFFKSRLLSKIKEKKISSIKTNALIAVAHKSNNYSISK